MLIFQGEASPLGLMAKTEWARFIHELFYTSSLNLDYE